MAKRPAFSNSSREFVRTISQEQSFHQDIELVNWHAPALIPLRNYASPSISFEDGEYLCYNKPFLSSGLPSSSEIRNTYSRTITFIIIYKVDFVCLRIHRTDQRVICDIF